jgi:hypothetical protein
VHEGVVPLPGNHDGGRICVGQKGRLIRQAGRWSYGWRFFVPELRRPRPSNPASVERGNRASLGTLECARSHEFECHTTPRRPLGSRRLRAGVRERDTTEGATRRTKGTAVVCGVVSQASITVVVTASAKIIGRIVYSSSIEKSLCAHFVISETRLLHRRLPQRITEVRETSNEVLPGRQLEAMRKGRSA